MISNKTDAEAHNHGYKPKLDLNCKLAPVIPCLFAKNKHSGGKYNN